MQIIEEKEGIARGDEVGIAVHKLPADGRQ